MSYVIEKNVPLPNAGRPNGASKYPFHQMEVGDSFIAEPSAQGAAYFHARKFGGKFCVRFLKEDDLVRVWRVA